MLAALLLMNVVDNSTDNVINKVLKASVTADIACYSGKLVYIFIFKNKIVCLLNDNCLIINKQMSLSDT